MTDRPGSLAIHPAVEAAIEARLAPIADTVEEAVTTILLNGRAAAEGLALLVEAHASLAEAILDLSRRLRRLEGDVHASRSVTAFVPPDG